MPGSLAGRFAVARSRARRRTWSGNRQRNQLLQLGPMKGVANDRTGHQDEAYQKNGADSVAEPVAMIRGVF